MKMSRSEELGIEIRKSFEQWNHIMEFGGSDPFWADGVGLNLVRGHIMSWRKECETELEPGDYPKEYYLELPPKVDANYMAMSDEIREAAKKSLEAYKKDENLRFLLSVKDKFDSRQSERICLRNVLNYFFGLEHFIKSDMLVEMRRHRKPDTYLDSFRECRKRAEKELENVNNAKEIQEPEEMHQMSLFEMDGFSN